MSFNISRSVLTRRAMTDSPIKKEDKDGEVCSWCGTVFHPTAQQPRPVCPRCYRLLISAGLKDEEIFAEEKPRKNKNADEG
jgi:uncharacterized OB-fold protein